MFRKILVATDFSETSQGALMWAEYLAKKTGASVHVLHVIPEMRISVSDSVSQELFEKLGENQVAQARDKLEEISEAMKDKGVKASFEISHGSAHTEILKSANKRKVDLIVLGTRGLSGIERLFLGSVAARVLRGASVPVLVVRKKKAPRLQKILVPTDTSKLSYKGLDFAVKFGEEVGVKKIDLLYCLETLGAPLPEKLVESLQKEISKRLDRKVKATTIPVEAHVQPAADASEGITEFASSNKIHMIIMASHGRSGVGRILLGSTAEKVIRKSPVPVLVIKAQGGQ